jgi:hypothetical protein
MFFPVNEQENANKQGKNHSEKNGGSVMTIFFTLQQDDEFCVAKIKDGTTNE